MTLEEAIKHCEKKAEELEELYRLCPATESELCHCNGLKDCKAVKNGKNKGCQKCASEHCQLAEWLKALKEIWDSGDCNDCRNGQCEWKPKLGQLVRFNCPHYVGVANEEVANEDSD